MLKYFLIAWVNYFILNVVYMYNASAGDLYFWGCIAVAVCMVLLTCISFDVKDICSAFCDAFSINEKSKTEYKDSLMIISEIGNLAVKISLILIFGNIVLSLANMAEYSRGQLSAYTAFCISTICFALVIKVFFILPITNILKIKIIEAEKLKEEV